MVIVIFAVAFAMFAPIAVSYRVAGDKVIMTTDHCGRKSALGRHLGSSGRCSLCLLSHATQGVRSLLILPLPRIRQYS